MRHNNPELRAFVKRVNAEPLDTPTEGVWRTKAVFTGCAVFFALMSPLAEPLWMRFFYVGIALTMLVPTLFYLRREMKFRTMQYRKQNEFLTNLTSVAEEIRDCTYRLVDSGTTHDIGSAPDNVRLLKPSSDQTRSS